MLQSESRDPHFNHIQDELSHDNVAKEEARSALKTQKKAGEPADLKQQCAPIRCHGSETEAVGSVPTGTAPGKPQAAGYSRSGSKEAMPSLSWRI